MDDAGRTRIARVFGGVDLLAALVTAIGVFAGLPARWWPIDTCAAVLVALLGAAGVGLLARRSWGERVARVASVVALGMGLALIAILALTASYLNGIYGAVGHGGAIILALVAALALPYLVVFPASQLWWLGAPAKRGVRESASTSTSASKDRADAPGGAVP